MQSNKVKEIKVFRCRDCSHSFDYSDVGADGQPMMCKCMFSKYLVLLSKPACNNFKQKES